MKIVTFGELMLRLTPPQGETLSHANALEVYAGGAEANVAAAFARLGGEARFIGRLPEGALGERALSSLRALGVETRCTFGAGRMGLYFAERGAGARCDCVWYDRKDSAFARARRQDFDWKNLLAGCDLLHLTGITPALGGECAEIALDAAQTAKELGLTVSLDYNYRSALWSREQARSAILRLMPCVDVLFGLDLSEREDAEEAAQEIRARYALRAVAAMLRAGEDASRTSLRGLLATQEGCAWSRRYETAVVERIGGGDAFAGAMLYALLHGFSAGEGVEFATAAGCLKHTLKGDFAQFTLQEVRALAAGEGARIKR